VEQVGEPAFTGDRGDRHVGAEQEVLGSRTTQALERRCGTDLDLR
jgi:hypothetical protein